jgi:integrase/recombinase XerD
MRDRRIVALAAEFLFGLGATKPSPHTVAAYRRDLAGITALMAQAEAVDPSQLTLAHCSKSALRRAFAGWAAGHAKASVLRTWSAWNHFFRWLVAEDLVEGNPMDGVGKPKASRGPVKVIRGVGAARRLLEAADATDPRARRPWPERDLALVATFAVTGIRLAEGLSLTVGSIDGPPGERRLVVVGKGDRSRTIPVHEGLERVIGRYLASRAELFPTHDLGHPATPLFVSPAGEPMTPRQTQYLVERLYVRAGIRAQVPPGALVHALRHTFATSALEGGASVLEVQQLLGHSSLDTTRRYLEATANELRDATKAHPAQVALRDFLS